MAELSGKTGLSVQLARVSLGEIIFIAENYQEKDGTPEAALFVGVRFQIPLALFVKHIEVGSHPRAGFRTTASGSPQPYQTLPVVASSRTEVLPVPPKGV